MKKRAIIKIYGLVQGVNFRYDTRRLAEKLDLSGWVKNELDGSVTIIAEGDENNLNKLVEWIKTGPVLAEIQDLKINWQKPKGENGFKMRYE